VIIAGHTRLLAAIKLGLTEVPILIADDLSPEQALIQTIHQSVNAPCGTMSFTGFIFFMHHIQHNFSFCIRAKTHRDNFVFLLISPLNL